MAITAEGHRVIGIRHFARRLREDGLIAPRVFYPRQASDQIQHRGVARVERHVNRILRDVAEALKTGHLPKRLRKAEITVRVGNDLWSVPIQVPDTIQALEKRNP